MKHQKVSLSSFQQYIAEQLAAAEAQEATPTDRRLGVLLGELHFLIPLGDMEEILPAGAITPVPLTHPWFLGLRSVSGRLIGVIDYVCYAHGIQQRITAASRILIPTIQSIKDCGFIVSAVIEICDLSVMEKSFVVEDEQERTIYIDQQQRQWREVNWNLLMKMPDFFQVAL